MPIHFDHAADHCAHMVNYWFTVARETEEHLSSWQAPMSARMRNIFEHMIQAGYYRGGVYATMQKPHFDFDRREWPDILEELVKI